MTDIEQKARELVKPHCTESDDHDFPQSDCGKCKQMAEEITAALQSAVSEEREECRRYIHEHESVDGCTDGHGGIFETCQFASCIDLRARGQKEKP